MTTQSAPADLYWVRERFGGGEAYRVIAPHICAAVLATLNRMYGVTGDRKKFPGAQPCSVMRADLQTLATEHYVVAPKTDGTRYLMLVSGSAESSDMVFMIDRSLSIWIVPLFFREPVHASRALFDGELVYDSVRCEWVYQIFDLVGCGTRFQPRDNYVKRMENARHLIQRELLPTAPNAAPAPMRVIVKRFYPTYKIDALLSDMERNTGCQTDGLVFTPVPLGVKPFRNRRTFKWKEQRDNTVDFALLYNVHVSERARANKEHLLNISRANGDKERSSDAETEEEQRASANAQRVCIRLPSNASSALRKLLAECTRVDTGARKSPPRSVAVNACTDVVHDCVDEKESSGRLISPDAIDYNAFEFHVIDGEKKMAYFAKVDPNVNRDFLQKNAVSIANRARPAVVECGFEKGVWKILLHRVDRELPNAEYTVEKTLQNIQENISLQEIADVVRNNVPPAHGRGTKRARAASPLAASGPPHSRSVHINRCFAPTAQQPAVITQTQTQPHPMSKIHPSRLAHFDAQATRIAAPLRLQQNAAPPCLVARKGVSAPQSVHENAAPPCLVAKVDAPTGVPEYDPCNPAMDAANGTISAQKADMRALLSQLQKSIENDPDSKLSSVLRQSAASRQC